MDLDPHATQTFLGGIDTERRGSGHRNTIYIPNVPRECDGGHLNYIRILSLCKLTLRRLQPQAGRVCHFAQTKKRMRVKKEEQLLISISPHSLLALLNFGESNVYKY